jgi:hypothetical protein
MPANDDKQEPLVRPRVVAGCVAGCVGAFVVVWVIVWLIRSIASNVSSSTKTTETIVISPFSAAQGWLLLAGVWSIAVLLGFDVAKRHGVLSDAVKVILAIAGLVSATFFFLGLVRFVTG